MKKKVKTTKNNKTKMIDLGKIDTKATHRAQQESVFTSISMAGFEFVPGNYKNTPSGYLTSPTLTNTNTNPNQTQTQIQTQIQRQNTLQPSIAKQNTHSHLYDSQSRLQNMSPQQQQQYQQQKQQQQQHQQQQQQQYSSQQKLAHTHSITPVTKIVNRQSTFDDETMIVNDDFNDENHEFNDNYNNNNDNNDNNHRKKGIYNEDITTHDMSQNKNKNKNKNDNNTRHEPRQSQQTLLNKDEQQGRFINKYEMSICLKFIFFIFFF